MTVPETVDEEVTYCEVHPDRETALRCNKCGRLMCAQCAVQTPVGYRCRECVRGIENRFYKATATDYLIVAAVCALIAGGGLFGMLLIGFFRIWFIALFAGILLGGFSAQTALQLTGKRRGRYSAQIATAAAIGGALVPGMIFGIFLSFPFLIYAGILASTVYGRFQIRI